VVTLSQGPHSYNQGRTEKKGSVLPNVSKDAATPASHGNTPDMYSPPSVHFWIPAVFSQANQVDAHAASHQSLCSTPRAWILRIKGEQNHRHALPTKMWRGSSIRFMLCDPAGLGYTRGSYADKSIHWVADLAFIHRTPLQRIRRFESVFSQPTC